jgi:hypothetical protein
MKPFSSMVFSKAYGLVQNAWRGVILLIPEDMIPSRKKINYRGVKLFIMEPE